MISGTIGHYKIIEKLGEGGMGEVYLADDIKLERKVAIKFLPHHLTRDKESIERFEREAKAAASLNHPNIVTIHDVIEVDGQICIVMEYIDGDSLRVKIDSDIPNLDQILNITKQICAGLSEAHKADIVHRDIKPENILIDNRGCAKILDFGLAKLKGVSKLTKEKSTLGTIHYLSPESLQGKGVDHRSDIWSLGVVLYELLTSEVPFQGNYEQAITYAILNEDPRLILELNKDVSVNLQQIVFKMLKKNCNERFQNMNEILQALQDIQIELHDKAYDKKERNIAVLPFENISPDKENDYFSDGLTEELIVNLSRLKNMKIVSRTTSMQYKSTNKNIKTIGKELNTRYIIEGSVRKHQDNLRISVQLIDVESDTQLWSETYKGKLADVFDIQEQVSKQIVDALLLKLTVTEKVALTKRATLNVEAFDLYLRGRDFLNQLSKNKVKIAIQLFEKAIEIDTRYAAAYAGLGHAYAVLYQLFERKTDLLDKSIELSLKALMYDAELSEAYASLSLAYYNKDLLDDALEASQKAIELDPDNFIAYWMLGRIYRCNDRDRESVDLFKKVTTLNPEFLTAYMDLRMVYEKLGEKKITDQILQNILTIAPKYLLKHPDDARAHMLYAIHLAIDGKIHDAKTEAAKALELDPTDPLMQYNAACFYSRIGEKHLALESLKKSVVSGYEYYEWIKRDPDLDGIRKEPEYIKLMKGK